MVNKISLAVFFGGKSVEHEISVLSAAQAIAAFDPEKYNVIPIYLTKEGKWYTGDALLEVDNFRNIPNLLQQCTEVYISPAAGDNGIYKVKKSFFGKAEIARFDIAFPILHGAPGEDGSLQGLFELKEIPYVGSDVLSSSVSMDKIISKMVMKESGISVTEYIWFYESDWFENEENIIKQAEEKIGYPIIVKPANLGSSVGISKADNQDELREGIEAATNFAGRILLEKVITNLTEINCSVMGHNGDIRLSVCEEPLRSGEILSYDDKYMSGGKNGGSSGKGMSGLKRKIPADLPEKVQSDINDLAYRTFKVLDNSGVVRIDFLWDRDTDQVYVNEINSIPGSLSFYLWEATDKTFTEELNDMVSFALKRHRQRAELVKTYDRNIFSMSGGKTGKA